LCAGLSRFNQLKALKGYELLCRGACCLCELLLFMI